MSKQNESLEAKARERTAESVEKIGERNAVEKAQTASPLSSEELLDFMLEGATDYSIFTTDAEGRVTSWNAGAERFFGYSKAEILGQNGAILFTPEDREIGAPEQELSTAVTEGRATDERWHLRKDGTRLWLGGMVRPHRNDAGRLQGFIKIGRDMTEQKRAEDALRRRERELSDFVDNATVGMQWIGGDGIIKWANKTELDLLGYTPEEYIGHHVAEFHADREVIENILERLTGDEALNDQEARLRCKDGTFRNVLINSNVFWEDGKFVYTRCFTRDITERKRAEQTVRESEARYRVVTESASDAIVTIDVENTILCINPAAEKMFGYALDEMLGNNLSMLMPERFRGAHTAGIKRYAATGKRNISWQGVEVTALHKDGHEVPVEITFGELYLDGKYLFTAVIRDITNRKLAREALEKSERQYHFLSEGIMHQVWTARPDGKLDYMNGRTLEYFGRTFEQMIGDGWQSFVHPDDVDACVKRWMKSLETGEYYEVELRLKKADGTYRWHSGCATAGRDSDGKIVKWFGTNTDINDKKLVENALRASEKRFRELVEILPIAVYVCDESGGIENFNKSAVELWGRTPKYKEIIDSYYGAYKIYNLNGDYLPPAECPMAKVLRTGISISNTELVIERPDESRRTVMVTVLPRLDEFGNLTGAINCLIDITERKRAEDELKASNTNQRQLSERLSAILNAIPAHICLLNGVGNILDVNATWRQFAIENNYSGNNFGIGSNYFEVCDNAIGEFSAEANQVVEGIKTVLSGKSNHFELEYPFHSPKEKRWFRLMVSPLQEDAYAGIVIMHLNITEQKLSKDALLQAEANYRNLVELSPAIVYLAKPFPPYEPIYVSPNVIKLGYQPDEWFNKNNMWISLIHEDDLKRVLQMTEEAMNQNLETDLEYRMVARDGSIHWVHDKGRFVSDEQGNKIGWQGVIVDVTKTKQLEEQLLQSQKLESIGRLAGGIAHDFNNMLTAINGYSELTLRRMKADDPMRRNIEEIKKAGERSAGLTQQLLAFSRRQVLHPKLVSLNEVIDEASNMLQRLLGEDIQFISVINPKLDSVMADFGQLSQIILNLTVNARDAMPRGGKLTIETANVFLDPTYTDRHAEVLSGAYVMLAVCDTGTGMDAETQKHIFEPFFTTKDVGVGTGLGLSTVYGIVKQSGGSIEIYSEEGVGTTFKIYLPRVADQADVVDIESNGKELSPTAGTILLVEDEDIVRALTKQVLEECGYTVIEARNGVEALAMCDSGDCKFDLLMTDVVMPQMGGRELADKLKEKLPDLQILFTSGYTDDAVVRHGVIEVGTNFIQKPFTPDSLAKKVRELLGASEEKSV